MEAGRMKLVVAAIALIVAIGGGGAGVYLYREAQAKSAIENEVKQASRRFESALDRYTGEMEGVTFGEAIESAEADVEKDEAAVLAVSNVSTRMNGEAKEAAISYIRALQAANRALGQEARLTLEADLAREKTRRAVEFVDNTFDLLGQVTQSQADALHETQYEARREENFAGLRRDDQRKRLRDALDAIGPAHAALSRTIAVDYLVDASRLASARGEVISDISVGWFPELPPGHGEAKMRERHREEQKKRREMSGR